MLTLFFSNAAEGFLFRTNLQCLEGVEFCSSPVTSLGVVADGVISAKTDPLRERTVLPHLLGEDTLNSEGLVCAHLLCPWLA